LWAVEYPHLLNLATDGAAIALHLSNAQGAKVTEQPLRGSHPGKREAFRRLSGSRLIGNYLTQGGAAGTPDGIVDDHGTNQIRMIFANNYILTAGQRNQAYQ